MCSYETSRYHNCILICNYLVLYHKSLHSEFVPSWCKSITSGRNHDLIKFKELVAKKKKEKKDITIVNAAPDLVRSYVKAPLLLRKSYGFVEPAVMNTISEVIKDVKT